MGWSFGHSYREICLRFLYQWYHSDSNVKGMGWSWDQLVSIVVLGTRNEGGKYILAVNRVVFVFGIVFLCLMGLSHVERVRLQLMGAYSTSNVSLQKGKVLSNATFVWNLDILYVSPNKVRINNLEFRFFITVVWTWLSRASACEGVNGKAQYISRNA